MARAAHIVQGPSPRAARAGTLAALVALAGLGAAPDASGAIYKCIALDGSVSYTGTPCDRTALDARLDGGGLGAATPGRPAAALPGPRAFPRPGSGSPTDPAPPGLLLEPAPFRYGDESGPETAPDARDDRYD